MKIYRRLLICIVDKYCNAKPEGQHHLCTP